MAFYSIVDYTGNGTSDDFSVTFPYLQKSHVEVYLSGVLQVVDDDYEWTNDTQITFDTAPALGLSIRIKRNTPKATREIDFTNGSQLIEGDLDTSVLQLLYITQEIKDELALTLATIQLAVSASGNVSTPANPGEDNCVLKALAGAYTWSRDVDLSTIVTGTLNVSGASSMSTLTVSSTLNIGGATTGTTADFSGTVESLALIVTDGIIARGTNAGYVMDKPTGVAAAFQFNKTVDGVATPTATKPRFSLIHDSTDKKFVISVHNGTIDAPAFTVDILGAGNAIRNVAAAHLMPAVTATYDLGTSSLLWRKLYLASGALVVDGNTSELITVVTDVQWNSSTGTYQKKTRQLHAVAAAAESDWTNITATYVNHSAL